MTRAADVADVQQTINGHLAAGEFGAALNAAAGVADAQQRDTLLGQVIGARRTAATSSGRWPPLSS
ncbi:MAG: hypothetical protein U0992_22880 [Planctomycetaceae bacterium]